MEAWKDPETLAIWLIIITLFFAALLGFIILLVRMMYVKKLKQKMKESKATIENQQRLVEISITTQEKERRRIAADIHDALIGRLTLLIMKQQIEDKKSDNIPLMEECISIARGISHELSPPLLEMITLHQLFTQLITPWKEIFNIEFTSDIRTELNSDNEFKLQITRIFQEIVTNATKHSKAKTISLHIRHTPTSSAFLLSDDGIGFDLNEKSTGLGLKNIEMRVQYLNGRFKLQSKPDKGTKTLIVIPFKKDQNEEHKTRTNR